MNDRQVSRLQPLLARIGVEHDAAAKHQQHLESGMQVKVGRLHGVEERVHGKLSREDDPLDVASGTECVHSTSALLVDNCLRIPPIADAHSKLIADPVGGVPG